ncbi:hypothetical protein C8Q80DRAFT_1201254 [Daedaleopsis nitida]|nr:hypothetical protein C8Q80DRAFT_1201254 [Daedaleopsis nitida]
MEDPAQPYAPDGAGRGSPIREQLSGGGHRANRAGQDREVWREKEGTSTQRRGPGYAVDHRLAV